ncbi:hypothetical protein MN116_006244 [Schistosoma mekongi]|uniref:LIM zinc-binding domain-containing protein n=1 Tax=Schistosoma mekongi TaxID=38744 RepID=A0AAE1ZBE9_SCHME|nr:hypothetical protein MN116_006244 [Schistosoma mekongi]
MFSVTTKEIIESLNSSNSRVVNNNFIMSEMKFCSKCRQCIKESHYLLADCQYWHEDCLRCVCCDARLAELDKIFYTKARMSLCRRDYLRLYGKTGECSVCQKRVQPYEFVMKIKNNVYHLSCFCCQHCQMRFCIGDRFYLHENIILCEHDYMELFPDLFTHNINLFHIEKSDIVDDKMLVNSCIHLNKTSTIQNHSDIEGDEDYDDNVNNKKSQMIGNYSNCIASNVQLFTKYKAHITSEQNFINNKSTKISENRLHSSMNAFDINFNDSTTISDDRSSGYGSPSSPGNGSHEKN